ncbi:MAG: hypothetical protein HKN23_13755, partial [Verrucomicrobiales bacterium]|nr:hypothetical protein [Verrucomicrobiales bacterium]
PTPPWFFYQQLSQDFDVETIPSTATEIPEDTDVLLILHPFDITDYTQFAVDQYLLAGGEVIAFVDPNFFFAEQLGQPSQIPGMPPQGGPAPSSTMDKLFEAWGVKYDNNQVLADLNFGAQLGRNFVPTYLNLDKRAVVVGGGMMEGIEESLATQLTEQMNGLKAQLEEKMASEDASETEIANLKTQIAQFEAMLGTGGGSDGDKLLMGSINNLAMLTPGAFEVSSKDGLNVTPLIQSSPVNQYISAFDADPREEEAVKRIREKFESSDKRRDLAVRISGNFQTAFPDGDPSAPAEPEPEPETQTVPDKGSEKGTAKGTESGDSGKDAKAADEGGKAEEPADANNCQDPADDQAEKAGKEEANEETSGESAEPALKKSKAPGTVILFADVDMIFDAICVQQFQLPGTNARFFQPLNDNVTLLQNAADQLSGDPDLMEVRSRQNVSHNFNKVSEWQADAEQAFASQLAELQEKLSESEEKMNRMLAELPEGVDEENYPPEFIAEREKVEMEITSFNRGVRELRRETNRLFRSRLSFFKILNTGVIPILVILVGLIVALVHRIRTAAR